MKPTSKITAVGIGGALATIAAWAVGAFTAVDVPPGVESALAVILAWLAGYLTEDPYFAPDYEGRWTADEDCSTP